jgi:pimeloyl-ACP methyl ester carboxylesterase
MNDIADGEKKAGGVEAVVGLKRHLLQLAGGPISAYEAGPEGRPAVVLLHGAMYDEARFIWDRLFPELCRDYRVFAIDLPRHGKSRPWQGFLDNDALQKILDETFGLMGLDRFSLVGLSMGGGLSLDFAARHPEKISALILFEPGGLGEKVDWQFLTWLYLKTPGALRLLSRTYVKKNQASLEKLLRSIYVGGSVPTDPDRLVAILWDEIRGKFANGENDLDDWQVSGIGPFRLKWNLLSRVPQIECPTLWLRGADSALVKQAEIDRALRLARQAQRPVEFELVPNAGHILPLERPERVNAIVSDFLARTVPR